MLDSPKFVFADFEGPMLKPMALANLLATTLSFVSVSLATPLCSAAYAEVVQSTATSNTRIESEAVEKEACAMGQKLVPLTKVGMYLDGYHSPKKDASLPAEKQQQIRTAHYCKQVNPDLFQCLLYDGNGANARVIGIEYVITDKLFKTLSASEQKYWHPHTGEVDTGLLVMPGLAKDKEKDVLASLRSTHGKTWQVWPNLADKVPLGEPELMWSVDPEKIAPLTKQSAQSRAVVPTF